MSRRHRIKGYQLSRTRNQRKALFRGLVRSLIEHEAIETTLSKAKAIQGLFEKLVTQARPATVYVRRLLHAFLGDRNSVNKLVDELSPRFKERPGGYTRLTKLGLRRGDNAPVVRLELVEKPKNEKPSH